MIHLIYGADAYRVRRALDGIRASLGTPPDLMASNTTTIDGAQATPGEILAHVTAVPFLAEHRLVIVEGLLRAIGGAGQGRRKKTAVGDDPLAPWRDLAARLADPAAMPDSTTLVFVEGEPGRSNAAFPIFAPIARSQEFKPLGKDELVAWVQGEAKQRGLSMSGAATALLAQMVGPDLWAMEGELDKLATYAAGQPIDEDAVRSLVAAASETKFWTFTDAIIAGDDRGALTALRRLLVEGDAPQRLLFMIAAEYRRIAVVKDMLERREPRAAIAGFVNSRSDFVVDKAVRNAGRFSWDAIDRAYALLLDADLNVKRGLQDDESALQLLVHGLCDLAPRVASRRATA